MKKNFIFYTVALTAGLFSACSSDDEQELEAPIRHISVEVSQQPMTSADGAEARSLTTRAAITTTETLSAFSMKGIYDNSVSNYSVSKSNETWTVDPNTWPGGSNNNDITPFYAFTQGDFQWNSGSPYISFTIAENASTQHDLLVATNNISYSARNGKVPLTFDHACAAVAFTVKMTNTLSNGLLSGKTLTVSSIVLRNVNNTGRYDFGTSSWSNVSGSAYYTLNNCEITITTIPQTLSSNYLFVIPQKRAANDTTDIYLDITYAFTGQTQTSATIPLDVDWKAGYQYTINIKLGTTLIK